MSRPVRLHRLTLVLLTVSVICLLITNACSVYLANQWHDYAEIAAANFERCQKALPVPPPRRHMMITGDVLAGAD